MPRNAWSISSGITLPFTYESLVYFSGISTYDPRFEKSMLVKCNSLEELQGNIGKGNWCLGQGFYYLNLCFINQVDGGDEWLTIKDDYAFESYTFSRIIKAGTFKEHINRMLNASKEACLSLNY